MRFTRQAFSPDAGTADFAEVTARLLPGIWLVEAGVRPPRWHRPAHLLSGYRTGEAVAVSLGSAAALSCELGRALAARIAAGGCLVDELAPLALHELVVNAAVHGNLGVPSGASAGWTDLAGRHRLIEEALADPVRAARVVTVALCWEAKAVVAAIADEGAGYAAGPARARAADDPRRAAGNGLRIVRLAGSLEVTRKGRRTRLVLPRRNPICAG